jgi:hypothetical protein
MDTAYFGMTCNVMPVTIREGDLAIAPEHPFITGIGYGVADRPPDGEDTRAR